jgi:hypothetical protein
MLCSYIILNNIYRIIVFIINAIVYINGYLFSSLIDIFLIPVNRNKFVNTMVKNNITRDNLNDINATNIHNGKIIVGNIVLTDTKQNTLLILDFE